MHEIDRMAQSVDADSASQGSDHGRRSVSSRSWKAAVWVITVVVSAFIGVAIKWWWEAPRPNVELSTVQLRPATVPKTRVDVARDLRRRIDRHAYIDNVKEHATVQDIRELISSAEEGDETIRGLVARIDRLLELLRTRSTTWNVDNRRQEFLTAWVEGGAGSTLESTVKQVLASREASLPALYGRPRAPGHLQWVQLS